MNKQNTTVFTGNHLHICQVLTDEISRLLALTSTNLRFRTSMPAYEKCLQKQIFLFLANKSLTNSALVDNGSTQESGKFNYSRNASKEMLLRQLF